MRMVFEGEPADDLRQQDQSLCRGQDMDRPALFVADRDADTDGEILFTDVLLEDARNVRFPGTAHLFVPLAGGEVPTEDLRVKGVTRPEGALAVRDEEGCELRIFLCQADQVFPCLFGPPAFCRLNQQGTGCVGTEDVDRRLLVFTDEERQEVCGGLVGGSDLRQAIPVVVRALVGCNAENQQEDEDDQKDQCAGSEVPG